MLRRGMLVLALVGPVACDLPTEPPRWEQTWVVPADSVTLGVGELLPSTIVLNDDGTAFVADVPATSVAPSLATLCGAPCEVADGTVVPKPAFLDTIGARSPLPEDVIAATLAGGSLDVTVAHDLSFDPLRPASDPAAERGYMLIRVLSGQTVVGRDSIDGADRAFPPGTSITTPLEIRPVDVSDEILVQVALYSPAGDPVEIDTSDTLGVTLPASTVELSAVTIAATEITLEPTRTPIDLGRLEDETVLDRIQSGAIRLRIHNPFTVTGALDVALELGSRTIQRSLEIREGDYTERLPLSAEEVRDILSAADVEVLSSGTVNTLDGTLTVTPAQEIVLEADIELVVLFGGGEG